MFRFSWLKYSFVLFILTLIFFVSCNGSEGDLGVPKITFELSDAGDTGLLIMTSSSGKPIKCTFTDGKFDYRAKTYNGPITVTKNATFRAACYDAQTQKLGKVVKYPIEDLQCQKPNITKRNGFVVISCDTENATIKYSIGENSDPELTGIKYEKPLADQSGVIKAVALKEDLVKSKKSEIAVYNGSVDAINVSNEGSSSVKASFITSSDVGKLYYTLDGTMPNEKSPSIDLTGTLTIESACVLTVCPGIEDSSGNIAFGKYKQQKFVSIEYDYDNYGANETRKEVYRSGYGFVVSIPSLTGITKPGYALSNLVWYTDAPRYTDDAILKEGTAIDGAIVAKPKWVANTYIVRFYSSNEPDTSTHFYEQSFEFGKSDRLTLNADFAVPFTDDHLSFSGWSLSRNGEVKYRDGENVVNVTTKSEVNLYAVFKTLKYNLSAEGSKSANSASVSLEVKLNSIDEGTNNSYDDIYVYYHFEDDESTYSSKENLKNNGTKVVKNDDDKYIISSINQTGTLKIVAYYKYAETIDTYTDILSVEIYGIEYNFKDDDDGSVTFYYADGMPSAVQPSTVGKVRTGYSYHTLYPWKEYVEDGSGSYLETTRIIKYDLVAEGNFTRNQYFFQYSKNNDTTISGSMGNSLFLYDEENNLRLNEFEKKSNEKEYEFLGWSTSSDLTDGNFPSNSEFKVSNKSVDYIYKNDIYIFKDGAKVKIDKDMISRLGLINGGIITLYPVFKEKIVINDDYTLTANYTYKDAQTISVEISTSFSQADKATIYYTTDGSEPTNSSKKYSSSVTVKYSETTQKLRFKGFPNTGETFNSSNEITVSFCRVTFNPNMAGTTTSDYLYIAGEYLKNRAPSVSMTGHNLISWKGNDSSALSPNLYYVVLPEGTNNVTYTAQWSPYTYIVMYCKKERIDGAPVQAGKTDDGFSRSVFYGQEFDLLTNPSWSACGLSNDEAFAGWYCEELDTTFEVSKTPRIKLTADKNGNTFPEKTTIYLYARGVSVEDLHLDITYGYYSEVSSTLNFKVPRLFYSFSGEGSEDPTFIYKDTISSNLNKEFSNLTIYYRFDRFNYYTTSGEYVDEPETPANDDNAQNWKKQLTKYATTPEEYITHTGSLLADIYKPQKENMYGSVKFSAYAVYKDTKDNNRVRRTPVTSIIMHFVYFDYGIDSTLNRLHYYLIPDGSVVNLNYKKVFENENDTSTALISPDEFYLPYDISTYQKNYGGVVYTNKWGNIATTSHISNYYKEKEDLEALRESYSKLSSISSPLTITAPKYLAMIWKYNTYTFKFEKGDSDAIGEIKDMTVKYGETVTLSGSNFTRSGFVVESWTVTAGDDAEPFVIKDGTVFSVSTSQAMPAGATLEYADKTVYTFTANWASGALTVEYDGIDRNGRAIKIPWTRDKNNRKYLTIDKNKLNISSINEMYIVFSNQTSDTITGPSLKNPMKSTADIRNNVIDTGTKNTLYGDRLNVMNNYPVFANQHNDIKEDVKYDIVAKGDDDNNVFTFVGASGSESFNATVKMTAELGDATGSNAIIYVDDSVSEDVVNYVTAQSIMSAFYNTMPGINSIYGLVTSLVGKYWEKDSTSYPLTNKNIHIVITNKFANFYGMDVQYASFSSSDLLANKRIVIFLNSAKIKLELGATMQGLVEKFFDLCYFYQNKVALKERTTDSLESKFVAGFKYLINDMAAPIIKMTMGITNIPSGSVVDYYSPAGSEPTYKLSQKYLGDTYDEASINFEIGMIPYYLTIADAPFLTFMNAFPADSVYIKGYLFSLMSFVVRNYDTSFIKKYIADRTNVGLTRFYNAAKDSSVSNDELMMNWMISVICSNNIMPAPYRANNEGALTIQINGTDFNVNSLQYLQYANQAYYRWMPETSIGKLPFLNDESNQGYPIEEHSVALWRVNDPSNYRNLDVFYIPMSELDSNLKMKVVIL